MLRAVRVFMDETAFDYENNILMKFLGHFEGHCVQYTNASFEFHVYVLGDVYFMDGPRIDVSATREDLYAALYRRDSTTVPNFLRRGTKGVSAPARYPPSLSAHNAI